MPRKTCCYNKCKNHNGNMDHEYMEGIFFVPFPKPRTEMAKCKRWIRACGRPNFITVEKIMQRPCYWYLCSEHFVDGLGPTDQYPDPMVYDPVKYMIDPRENPNYLQAYDSSEIKEEVLEDNIGACSEIGEISQEQFNNCRTQIESPDAIDFKDFIEIEEVFQTKEDSADTEENVNFVKEERITMDCSNPNENIEGSQFLNNIVDENYERKISLLLEFCNLKDIFSRFWNFQIYNVGHPINWGISRNTRANSLSVYSTSKLSEIGFIMIEINEALELKIIANGISLTEDHELFPTKYPRAAKNLEELLKYLACFVNFKTCSGSPEWEFLKLVKQEDELAFLNTYTNAIHSKNCQGLFSITRKSRCKNCAIVRIKLTRKFRKWKHFNDDGDETLNQGEKLLNKIRTGNSEMQEKIKRLRQELKQVEPNRSFHMFQVD